jgi:predicted nucleic acid-binding protein
VPEGLFDTTFFIDYLRGDPGARGLWRRVVSDELVGWYSPITVTELWLSPNTTQAEESILFAMRSLLRELPLNTRAAEHAGLFLRGLPASQAERLIRDALIGCAALVQNLPVYTRNVRDLSRFATTAIRY